MKPAAQTTFAERIGRTLGRLWRGCVRLDRRATHWLVAKGWEPGVAKAMLLLVKLAAIGMLLFAAFWSVLAALTIVVVAAWTARSLDDEDDSMSQTEGGMALLATVSTRQTSSRATATGGTSEAP